jgi:ABC-type phosphate transport system permease subunit
VSVHLLIGAAVVLAAGAAIYLEERRRSRRRDIEAFIDATRENMPDHVPDAWVKEHGR